MEQITITREEFEKRIVNNPKGYGIVRARKENPERYSADSLNAVLDKAMLAIILREIEEDLFGDEPEEKKDPVKDALKINLTLFKED